MALRLPNESCDVQAQALVDRVDAGSYVEIRTGLQPASANDSASGTLLVTIMLNSPAYAAPTGGSAAVLDVSPALTGTAVATGTAGWGRVYNSADETIYDGQCHTSGAEFVLDILAVETGDTVTLSGGSYGVSSGE